MTLRLERVAFPEVPWGQLDHLPGRVVTQTRPWLDFLVETQGIVPVAAQVLDGAEPVGWFTGGVVRRGGLRFLGSPLRGWTTAAMGSTLEEGVDPALVLAALPRFAFAELGCIHLECADRSLLDATRVPTGFHVTTLPGYELELAIDGEPRSDADLLAAMTPHGRRDVRRSLRNGIVVEAVDPLDPGDFASVYYQQVSEAFARRSRRPTYPVERVEALIRHLGPTGDLLLLRSRTPAGEVAATGIFPGIPGGTAEFWMGASTRSLQPQLPNEALMWEALRRWRDRGASRFNFGGGGTYKAKYGGAPHTMPWARRSRFAGLEPARAIAFDLYRRRQRAVR